MVTSRAGVAEKDAALPPPAADGFDRRAIPAHATESRWTAPDGWAIRRIDWPVPDAARGSLLLLGGRGDFYEKYLETMEQFHRAGFAVTGLDWRGQGGSGRFLDDPHVGHVERFDSWIDDLTAFWREWTASRPGPHSLLAHSMGGQIALRAAVDGRVVPDRLLLSAPMLGFHLTGMPFALAQLVARAMARLLPPGGKAWKEGEKPLSPARARQGQLTHDPVRYADEGWWWEARPELKLGAASWRWVAAAMDSMAALARPGRIEGCAVPTLMVSPVRDALVDAKAAARIVRRLPNGAVRLWSGAAHEILREAEPLRSEVIATLIRFIDRPFADA